MPFVSFLHNVTSTLVTGKHAIKGGLITALGGLMAMYGAGGITAIGFEGQVEDLAAEGEEVVDLLSLCYDDQHGLQ